MIFMSVSQKHSEREIRVLQIGIEPNSFRFGSVQENSDFFFRVCLCHLSSHKPSSFLSQSLPFPAVTFCNFNAIKNNSLQAAKDRNRKLFKEVFLIELGKWYLFMFPCLPDKAHIPILAKTSLSDPKSTN